MSSAIAGNTTTTASLTIGTTVSGSLDFWGDTDWWRVTLTGGFAYQIWLEGASSGMGTLIDPYLAIYKSIGTFQHDNDDYNIFTRDSYLTTIPNGIGGTFYISAGEYGNNGTGTPSSTLSPRKALIHNESTPKCFHYKAAAAST